METFGGSSLTQLGAVIGFLGALFVLYRLLVQQKDAVIQLQKDQIAYLKDQLAEAKSQSPDMLAQSLANRVTTFENELKRLNQDKSATEGQIKETRAELEAAVIRAEELTKQVLRARTLLKDFLCPHCGAPMLQRALHWEPGYYGDRTGDRAADADHEHATFECGYETFDGDEVAPCRHPDEEHVG